MRFFSRRQVKRRTLSARPKGRPQSREKVRDKNKRPPGVFRRKMGKVFSWVWVLAGTILLAALVLGGVFFFAFFSIQRLEIAREDIRVDGEEIGAQAQHFIGANIFLLSGSSVSTRLKNKFPEIANVEIDRKLPNTLRITVSTQPIAFRWSCQRSRKELSEEGEIIEKPVSELYYVNVDGRVSVATPEEQNSFLIYEKSPCPESIRKRDRILPTSTVSSIFEAKQLLEKILDTTIDRSGFYRDAREIHLITTEETAIWIDFATPIADQIAKLEAAIALDPTVKVPQHHIDLRISDKIFYEPAK